MVPAALYKYQPIGPHTGLNLVLLLKHKVLFFPRKHALNDPTDCEPHLVPPEPGQATLDALDAIAASEDLFAFFKDEAKEVRQALSDPKRGGAALTAPNRGPALGGLFSRTAAEQARDLILSGMRLIIGTPRIFSMSSNWGVGQMWSYYANSHRGLCLEISGLDQPQPEIITQRVAYTTERPQVFLDEVLALSTDSPKREQTVRKLYCVKSDAWKHEDEYRLVARDSAAHSAICFLSIPEGDFYRIEGVRLSAVYFGQHCSDADKWMIKDLIRTNVPANDLPRIFEVRQSSQSYELDRVEASYDRFPFLPRLPAAKRPAAGLGSVLAGQLLKTE